MRSGVSEIVTLVGLAALAACAVASEEPAAPRLQPVEPVAASAQQAVRADESWDAATERYARHQLGMEPARTVESGLELHKLGGGETPYGLRYQRWQQRYRGVPILGADVSVVGRRDAVTSMHGNAVTSPEALDGVDAQLAARTFDDKQALALAFGRYLRKATDRTTALTAARQKAELAIIPGELGLRLVYRVELFTELQGGIEPGLWITLLDAATGEIVEEYNALNTLSQASGPGGNPRIPRTWTNQLDVEPSGSLFMMDTARLRTATMNHGTSGSGTVITGPLNPIGDADSNEAHGFAEIALDYMLSWHNETSYNGAGAKILSRVHYGVNYTNAFFDGMYMTYGDAVGGYLAQNALDFIVHEVSHAYTSFHSNLTFSGQSGGMNESFSDIAGESAEAYFKNAAPDFLVAADASPTAAGIRNLCTPTSDGRSIDHYTNYRSGMDVHYSSGVMNKAFCLATRRLASGSPTGAATLASVRRASTAWHLANKAFWTSGATFQQGCQGVFDAASALGFTTSEKWALRQSWIDVGITCGTAVSPTTFAVNSLTAFEDIGFMIFTVTKTNDDGVAHTINYAGASGTATAGVDFDSFSGTLSFAPADTTRFIAVFINEDTLVEGNEKFTVNLSGLTGGGTITTPQGIGTILNND